MAISPRLATSTLRNMTAYLRSVSGTVAAPYLLIRTDQKEVPVGGRAGASHRRGDEARLVRHDDGLRTVAGRQLGQHVAHVGLDRLDADDQLGGDLGVGQAGGHQ